LSILATEISPELVPADGGAIQSTQSKVGPYELQDFHLYYITRYGLRPSKVAFLAWHAWRDIERGAWPPDFPPDAKHDYTIAEIKKWLGVFLFRFFQIKPSEDSAVTEDEIKAIINEGTEQGAIEEAEQEIIERVFHLGDRNITSLMTHRSDIIWFDLHENEETIKEKIIREPHSVYPICDGEIDNIKGVVSIKDLYVTDDNVPFKDIMTQALFVPENNTAYMVLEKFKQSKIHCCFIVDEYGSLLGLITLNDILEAIIGDIAQPDVPDYEIKERPEGGYLIDGQIPFYDFLAHFHKADWLTEGGDDFDTLAGFILSELEHIPGAGERLEWRGFTFEIVDMDAARIDKVLVTLSEEMQKEYKEEEEEN